MSLKVSSGTGPGDPRGTREEPKPLVTGVPESDERIGRGVIDSGTSNGEDKEDGD